MRRKLFLPTRPFKKSLLANTLVVVGAASLLVASLIIVITLLITQRYVQQQSLDRLQELIESMSSMASVACFAKDATLAMETAQGFTKHSSVREVAIIAYGRILAVAKTAGVDGGDAPQKNRQPLIKTIYSPFDATERIGEVVVIPNWQVIQDDVTRSVRLFALLLILLASGIVGVIAIVVSVVVVKPVKGISDQLHALDPSSPDTLAIPPKHGKDELGRLVSDMNDLITRFRSSLNKEHELHLQKVLNERLRLYQAMFENSQEGIVITDRTNSILAVNAAFTQITGYLEKEVVGKNPNLLSSGRQNQEFYERMWKELFTLGHWRGEMWNRCKSGQIKPKWFSISVIKDEQGEIVNYVSIFSDISERKLAEERIEFLAHHDALTKLPNRILTRDRFELAQAAALRDHGLVAMLYVDLDNFKYVNDSFGHQAGDQLLLSVVERLQRHIRETDTVSRQGGDEFLLILPGVKDMAVVNRIAVKILDDLSAPFDIEEQKIGISACIGIACYPEHGADYDTLLRNSDAAMYAAKSAGKNGYRVFSEEMNSDALEKLMLKAHLTNALDDHQFYLVYQPQLDIANGKIIGAEALIRWTQPELGNISPARFIPLAEESGLIGPIGDWVLEEACRQGKKWLDSGLPPFVMAVNVSSQQFNYGELFDSVTRVLETSGLPPHLLELEFTETGLLADVEHSATTIEKLMSLGIKLSIDDFGTGYSSLSYLKQFKVQKLKIDQSFIRDIMDDHDDLEIVRAIIQLGITLQLDVIAEGVETEAQLMILKELGCHEAQGYLISKPLSPAAFEEFAST